MKAKNEAEESDWSYPYKYKSAEDAGFTQRPSAPYDFKESLSDRTSNSVMLTWRRPSDVARDQQIYYDL